MINLAISKSRTFVHQAIILNSEKSEWKLEQDIDM